VAIFAGAVDDREDHRFAVHPRQSFHEIEADRLRWELAMVGGGRRGGGAPSCTVGVASEAFPHKVLHTTSHVGKMKVTAQTVQRVLDPLVPVVVDGSHDLQQQWRQRRYVRPSKVTRPSVSAHEAVRVPTVTSSWTATKARSVAWA
jgi:hypothetical protein